MQQNDQAADTAGGEINFFGIFDFIADNWKTIVGMGFAGSALAGGYLTLVPPQYEADALVEMAQMRTSGSNTPPGINIVVEAPAMLMERLKIPTTYTREVMRACALEGQSAPGVAMTTMVRAELARNIASVVTLKVRHRSPDLAKQCAVGVFEMVREQQAELVKPYKDELKESLSALRARFHESQDFVSQMEKTALFQATYLVKRDELLVLAQQIDQLQRAIARDFQTRLVSPVYVPAESVRPTRLQTLILGTLAGSMLGLFVAQGRKLLINWRSNRG